MIIRTCVLFLSSSWHTYWLPVMGLYTFTSFLDVKRNVRSIKYQRVYRKRKAWFITIFHTLKRLTHWLKRWNSSLPVSFLHPVVPEKIGLGETRLKIDHATATCHRLFATITLSNIKTVASLYPFESSSQQYSSLNCYFVECTYPLMFTWTQFKRVTSPAAVSSARNLPHVMASFKALVCLCEYW